MRRVFSVLAISLVGLLLLASVGLTKDSVIVPSWWAPHEIKGAEAAFAERFTPESGIEVKYEFIGSGYFEKMWARLSSGRPYDVMTFNAHDLAQFVDKDALVPLNQLVERDGYDLDDFDGKAIEQWTYDGKLYGFTNDMGSFHFYYNKDLFEQAGLDAPALNWTWDEFLTNAKKLTVRTATNQMPEQWGFVTGVDWDRELWPGMNGGFIFNEDMTRCTLDDPKVIEAYQFRQDLIYEHRVTPSPGTIQLSAFDMFLNGKVGMLLDGTWGVGYFRSKNPTFEWDVAIPPHGPAVDRPWIPAFTAGWVIPRGVEDLDASWETMKFYASKDFAENVMFTALSSLPTRQSALDGGKYNQWPVNPPQGLNREFYSKMLEYGFSKKEIHHNLGAKITASMEKIDLILGGQRSADSVLPEITQEINKEIVNRPWYGK